MSEPIDNGGPAQDMTLRDAIAIEAMQGVIASGMFDPPHPERLGNYAEAVSAVAYAVSLAMLAERKKGQP